MNRSTAAARSCFDNYGAAARSRSFAANRLPLEAREQAMTLGSAAGGRFRAANRSGSANGFRAANGLRNANRFRATNGLRSAARVVPSAELGEQAATAMMLNRSTDFHRCTAASMAGAELGEQAAAAMTSLSRIFGGRHRSTNQQRERHCNRHQILHAISPVYEVNQVPIPPQ